MAATDECLRDDDDVLMVFVANKDRVVFNDDGAPDVDFNDDGVLGAAPPSGFISCSDLL